MQITLFSISYFNPGYEVKLGAKPTPQKLFFWIQNFNFTIGFKITITVHLREEMKFRAKFLAKET